jgi:hypothetical protein
MPNSSTTNRKRTKPGIPPTNPLELEIANEVNARLAPNITGPSVSAAQ